MIGGDDGPATRTEPGATLLNYRISTERRGGGLVHSLHDDRSGARASVLPAFGFNLFDLRLPAAGKLRRVIVSEPDWEHAPRQAGRNGIPVLFPFPNRIQDARFSFGGQEYRLPVNSKPHAIHGFAIQADWEVVEHVANESGATLAGRYQLSRQSPEMRPHWPTDAVLDLRYTLAGRRLTLDVGVTNPTADPLPYGFGIHPYFQLPLQPGGDPARTRIVLPAAESWVLDGYIPTGDRKPVDERLDFREGKPILGLMLDDVLTGLTYEGGRGRCRLMDLALDCEVVMDFENTFRELVVFTPPGVGDLISVEPYTQTTAAVNLAARGVDGGLRVLEHGRHDHFSLGIETRG